MKNSAVEKSNEPPTDIVRFGKDQYMPRELYRRSRLILKMYLIAALSPLALLVVSALLPIGTLMSIAALFRQFFWIHVKQVSFGECAEKCHMVAYSLVAIPISWFGVLVCFAWAIPLVIINLRASREALRLGTAPYGKNSEGPLYGKNSRGPVSLKGLFVSIRTSALFCAILLVCLILLYGFAGSDNTVSRGREIPPALVSWWTTLIMGLAQFSAAALGSMLAGFVFVLKNILSPKPEVSDG